MFNAIKEIAKKFLEESEKKSVRIISHYDTDGITSAAILVQTLKRLDKKFSVRIIKGIDNEIINEELKRNKNEILLFLDLGSNNVSKIENAPQTIFILDHHEIDANTINKNIQIINPHLFSAEEICSAGISYLFSKAISPKNIDLSPLAVIGMIGDRHEENISKTYREIINDASGLEIRKSLLIFSATRPLKRALEYSTSFYIPGVTGSSQGVIELLRDIRISSEKTLCDLTEEEISRLVTAISLRISEKGENQNIIGNIYLLKFFNKKEDVREISALINACSRLGSPETAILFCLQIEKAHEKAIEIYAQYKQELIQALKNAEQIDKIKGNGFIIMNAKDKIKDTIIGTVTSILSSSLDYESGTILIGMAYNQEKIKVSARVVGKEGKNLKSVLEEAIILNKLEAEVGGHNKAAGCLINKQDEEKFIEALKKNLEIELVKI